MYDIFDEIIAEYLNMSVENYITYIESLTEEEQDEIIIPILSKAFDKNNKNEKT